MEITLDQMEEMARATIAGLPDAFRSASHDIVLKTADWPPDDMLRELQIDRRDGLTGLYEGIPLTLKSLSDPSPYPDVIWLFREPILAECRARGNVTLQELVAHVTIHELAHHFGWSDDDIAQIDQWWL